MDISDDTAYNAMKAHDARFDGRFFVGVTSTGVYCRPVCRVRLPRRENCRFFGSRALAEAARFRPCMKCRPEIAPGLSAMDSSQALADAAARFIEHAVHRGEALHMPVLAARLGVTDRHLRRIFMAAQGVSPHDYLTTQRLLLAKHLLTDTQQSVTQVALACGFGSLRRFNAAFAQHYRLNPTQLRKADGEPASKSPKSLRLAYRPPYDVASMLAFFAQRAMPGVETVEGLTLRRTVRWCGSASAGRDTEADANADATETMATGWLSAQFVPDRFEVHLQLSPSLQGVSGAVLQQLRQMLDLDADSDNIDPVLQGLPVPHVPGTRLPGCFDAFEVAVRVILGQQVTVKAARTLAQRLVQRFGTAIETPWPGLDRLFPDAQTLAAADPAEIGTLGIVRQRVGALQALARAVSSGQIQLQAGGDINITLDALRALPGVGDWTAQVIALRTLSHADAWPASDIGLMNALGTRHLKTIEALAAPWRPWRGYAVMRLWHHLETGT